MRVLGGRLRGKLIHNPTDKTTRPLKDMVRESIFNILEHSKNENIKFKNNIILDLFAGSGSFGIECLSRGVKKVYFFESYKPSLKILKKNIINLELNENSVVIENDVYKISNQDTDNNKIDLIYLDPPFKDKKINNLLEIINACCNSKLNTQKIKWKSKKSICIALCSKGYPEKYSKNVEIKNLKDFK